MKRLYLITRGIAFVFLSLSVVVLSSTALHSRVPRAATVSRYDNSVRSEPGEDPHLKVEPVVKVEPIWSYGSSAGPASSGAGRELLFEHGACRQADGPVERSDLFVVWRILFNSLWLNRLF